MKRLLSYLLTASLGGLLWAGSAQAQTIRRVHVASTGSPTVIRVEGDNLKSPQVSLWKGNMLVVEFAARFSGKGSQRAFSTPHTSYLRYGWYTSSPPRARVVVTLKGKPAYKVQGSSSGYTISVGGNVEDGLKDFGKEMGKQMGEALGEVFGAFSEALGESLAPSELEGSQGAEIASEKPVLGSQKSSTKTAANKTPPSRTVLASGTEGNSGSFTVGSAPPPGETRISLDFVGAEIGDVLKALAIQSGANIVTGSDVKGAITVSLNNVSVEESLDLVTRLSGYHYRRIGSTYVVGTPKSLETFESRGEVGSVVETVMLAIAPPVDVAKYLSARFPNIQVSIPEAPTKPAYLLIKGFANEVTAAKTAALEFEQTVSGGAEIVTEAYRIQYAEASDLIRILSQLVPGVTATMGPQPINVNLTGAGVPSLGNASSGGSSGSATAGAPTGGASSSNAQAAANSPALIILMGPPRDILKALDVLKKVDVKVQQVLIEARVADLSEGAMQSLGFSWNVLQSGQVNNLNRENPVPMPLDPGTSYPNQQGMEFNKDGDLTLGFSLIKSPLDLSISLSAVFEDRRNRLLANPRVAVLDGREATIFIGDEVNYVKLIQQTPQGANVETDRVNAGIILNVVPRIHEDGKITLHIKPEVSVISGFLQVPGGGSLPQVAKRTAQTTVRVQDGETIVIGGLIRESDIRAVQKVPLLGDLPIIGQLFRKTSNSKNKSEVVIMITVQILKD